MAKLVVVAAIATPIALLACHSDDLPSDPPKTVTKVTSGGFTSPSDAVASPDGREFYFTAYDDLKEPALYKTSSAANSTAEVLAAGDPLEAPIGLVLSCDGATLYVADMSAEGGVWSIPTAGGTLADLAATNIVRPGGLAMGPDCKTLYANARRGRYRSSAVWLHGR